jgi:hypothetical protein
MGVLIRMNNQISRKSWLAYQAKFNMDVIRTQEREQEKEETAKLIAFFEEMERKQ